MYVSPSELDWCIHMAIISLAPTWNRDAALAGVGTGFVHSSLWHQTVGGRRGCDSHRNQRGGLYNSTRGEERCLRPNATRVLNICRKPLHSTCRVRGFGVAGGRWTEWYGQGHTAKEVTMARARSRRARNTSKNVEKGNPAAMVARRRAASESLGRGSASM